MSNCYLVEMLIYYNIIPFYHVCISIINVKFIKDKAFSTLEVRKPYFEIFLQSYTKCMLDFTSRLDRPSKSKGKSWSKENYKVIRVKGSWYSSQWRSAWGGPVFAVACADLCLYPEHLKDRPDLPPSRPHG